MDKTSWMINKLKSQPQKQMPICTNMFLPNHSGDHSAGTTKVPVKEESIANKVYVDTAISGISVHEALTLGVANGLTLSAGQVLNFPTNATPSVATITVGDGTATAPAIAFANDPHTGFFRITDGYFFITCNGIRSVEFGMGYIAANTYYPAITTSGLTFNGMVNDGAGAISMKTQNYWNLVTAGAKVQAWYKDYGITQVAYIDKDGSIRITIGGGTPPTASSAYRGQLWVTEGGAGVADIFKICLKAAGDTYSWVTVGTG